MVLHDMTRFCENEMIEAEDDFPQIAGNTGNLSEIFEAQNCSVRPSCQQLVDEGLDMALAAFELRALTSSAAGLVASSLMVASILLFGLMLAM